MSQRMIDQFMEMVRIDSESGEEARMMEYLLGAIANAGGSAGIWASRELLRSVLIVFSLFVALVAVMTPAYRKVGAKKGGAGVPGTG